jgi:hypothetical protein
LALAPFVAFAAPSISSVSGNISKDQTVTILGSSFGTHADYSPSDPNKLNYAWTDFDAGTAFRNGVNNGGGFTPACHDADCHQDWLITSTGNKANSSYWAKRIDLHDAFACNVDGMSIPASYKTTSFPGTYFVSFYFNIPNTASSGKFYRESSNLTMWTSTGGSDHYVRGPVWTSPSQFGDGIWERFDMTAINGVYQPFILGKNSNSPQWTWNLQSESTVGFLFGAGKDYGSNINLDYYGYDDIFIDFTQARVEICGESTWMGRSSCNIQIPQVWSASSLNVKVNPGSLASGPAYLYVVDSSGVANANGFPITLGGGSNPLSAPTGLNVVE